MKPTVREIGNYLMVDENQTTNFNKDIMAKDLQGNTTIVVKCYCTIVARKTISYYMTIENHEIFEQCQELIQQEVEKFKNEAMKIAKEQLVPII